MISRVLIVVFVVTLGSVSGERLPTQTAGGTPRLTESVPAELMVDPRSGRTEITLLGEGINDQDAHWTARLHRIPPSLTQRLGMVELRLSNATGPAFVRLPVCGPGGEQPKGCPVTVARTPDPGGADPGGLTESSAGSWRRAASPRPPTGAC